MLGRAWRFVVVAVISVLLFIGVPYLLARLGGWPLPTKMPNWDNVYWAVRQGNIPSEFVIKFFATIGWLAWAQLVWAVIWEMVVNVPRVERGRRPRRAPLTLPVIAKFAGRGVAVALALFSATTSTLAAAPSLSDFSPANAPAANVSTIGTSDIGRTVWETPTPATATETASWVVAEGDSLWDIAEQCLGDGSRVDDILLCNPGLDISRRLTPGQAINLPDGIAAPASRSAVARPTLAPAADNVRFDIDGAMRADHSDDVVADLPTVERDDDVDVDSADSDPTRVYVVEEGDSVFGIAERIVGSDDEAAVYQVAREIIETNIDQTMNDGRVFNDPSLIHPGWEIVVPAGGLHSMAAPDDGGHEVIEGETLWSIADDELGDGERWDELYEANEGREFGGEVFDDPSLIRPGWDLIVPGDEPGPSGADQPVATPEVERPETPAAPAATAGPAAAENVRFDPFVEPSNDIFAEPAGDPSDIDVVPLDLDAPIGDALPAPHSGGGVRPADVADALADNVNDPEQDVDAEDVAVGDLQGLAGATILAAGLLTLLAVRRKRRLREAMPLAKTPTGPARTAPTELLLRRIAAPERFMRVDLAVRAAARQLVGTGSRIQAVVVDDEGAIELYPSDPAPEPSAPWQTAGRAWTLPGSLSVEELAEEGRRVGSPTPLLIQVGVDDLGREVFVDLEALGAIEVGGAPEQADAIANAIALSLAGSVLAEVSTLVGLSMPDEAFLGHVHYHGVAELGDAFEVAATVVSSTGAMEASTFDLRTRATSGESWEPAAIIAGSGAGEVRWSDTKGVALVSAAPIVGPSSRLAPEGGEWVLKPLGLYFTPIGIDDDELAAVDDLITGVAALGVVPDDADDTILPLSTPPRSGVVMPDDDTEVRYSPAEVLQFARRDGAPTPERAALQPPEWDLLVRLMGPVNVVTADGQPVEFERAKGRELVAWLATHRDNSSRRGARTAMWESDVRDATFANVVSDARRAMARLVEPPDGEWIDRTMTDELPLHTTVRTDAELIEFALGQARQLGSTQAIAMLRPAVERIVGLPFDGSGYLWPDAEGLTSNLVLLAVSASADLAARYLELGDIDGVFWATTRGLRVLPGHEELVGLRMRAYASTGDRAGVRSEWESYERVIAADAWSDGEPSEKLVRLRTELLRAS